MNEMIYRALDSTIPKKQHERKDMFSHIWHNSNNNITNNNNNNIINNEKICSVIVSITATTTRTKRYV